MSGKLIIISSPSGGGKDSVINALLKIIPNSTRLVTTTTRAPRPGNTEGVDYYFINLEEFKQKIKNDEMLEFNIYAGNYYGTEKEKLTQALNKFDYVFTQIEVNGKHNLDKKEIENISIFLLPENEKILRKRIEKRGGITPEIIEERMKIATAEIEKSKDYDLRIVNKDGYFEETVAKIEEYLQVNLDTKTDLG